MRRATWACKAAVAFPTVFATVLTTGAALADERDISGCWTNENSGYIVRHDPQESNVVITVPFVIASLGATPLVFRGSLGALPERFQTMTPDPFGFHTELEPISWESKKTTCTLSGKLAGMGDALGQPTSELRMHLCHLTVQLSCNDGKHRTIERDCSGEWL